MREMEKDLGSERRDWKAAAIIQYNEGFNECLMWQERRENIEWKRPRNNGPFT